MSENPNNLLLSSMNRRATVASLPRILLFDIDGTLIRAVRRPEYRRLINEMLLEVFGTCGRIREVDFGGRTDLSIYREALECEGITIEMIQEKLPLVETRMVAILERLAASGEVFKLCAGVRELLDLLHHDERFFSCLLTGNVEKLAQAKLRVVDIHHYFQGRGAFGNEAENRDHLPEIAAQRMRQHFRRHIEAKHFVIIGDTPRDISCARYFGAKVVAVATGTHSVEELQQHHPDAVLADLSDTPTLLPLLHEI
ncbi:MAG: HAD hydrolase-like protein [Acidobacteria bacterium]|nr:HAD hydrolase-like protein [Acidobacteriota bacterium]